MVGRLPSFWKGPFSGATKYVRFRECIHLIAVLQSILEEDCMVLEKEERTGSDLQDIGLNENQVVVSNIFYFHPYLEKIPMLTSIFFRWVGSTTK